MDAAVPPAQCPECGRFLSKDFVAALTTDPTPCPSCQTGLHASDFGAAPAVPPAAADPPSSAAGPADQPATDPLAGWDRGQVVDLEDWRSGQADRTSDVAVIGIAAGIGALLGLVLGKPGRFLAMLVGALLGAGAGAASRRVWELDR